MFISINTIGHGFSRTMKKVIRERLLRFLPIYKRLQTSFLSIMLTNRRCNWGYESHKAAIAKPRSYSLSPSISPRLYSASLIVWQRVPSGRERIFWKLVQPVTWFRVSSNRISLHRQDEQSTLQPTVVPCFFNFLLLFSLTFIPEEEFGNLNMRKTEQMAI